MGLYFSNSFFLSFLGGIFPNLLGFLPISMIFFGGKAYFLTVGCRWLFKISLISFGGAQLLEAFLIFFGLHY